MQTKKQKREKALAKLQEEYNKLKENREMVQRTVVYYIIPSLPEIRLELEINNLKRKLGVLNG